MVAAADIGREGETLEGERRVLLRGVSWAAYTGLRDSVQGRHVHMTFLRGVLEIMTTGRTHEVRKKQIARLLELFCLERDIPLFGYGNMTRRLGRGDARQRLRTDRDERGLVGGTARAHCPLRCGGRAARSAQGLPARATRVSLLGVEWRQALAL
jgi:hypothetical protein